MRKFTVKDFLLYACPCYGCNSPTAVYIGVSYTDNESAALMDGSIMPVINQNHTRVDLKISYNSALSIAIDHKTNKFATNSEKLLKKYLQEHAIYLQSVCTKCNTQFETRYLSFNLDKLFILPVEMKNEFFVIRSDQHIFHCFSSYEEKSTHVDAVRLDQVVPLSSTKLSLPLLPGYKFKTKEQFVQKMKTYLLFS